MHLSPKLLTAAVALGLLATSLLSAELPPLTRAHAHNDYAHPRPLFDALDHGFGSVEADVFLVEGQLWVGHNREDLKPERTLTALYLDPLRARVQKNGGRVYRDGPSVMLLIDIKTDATNTYRAVRETLHRYEPMLTLFFPDHTETNAITVVITGERPRELMAAETRRLAGYDGRISDLKAAATRHFMPLVSDNWTTQFRWRGAGALPASERIRLRNLVAETHARGQQLRLWGAPDTATAWDELLSAGIDWVNTDDLAGFEKHWRSTWQNRTSRKPN